MIKLFSIIIFFINSSVHAISLLPEDERYGRPKIVTKERVVTKEVPRRDRRKKSGEIDNSKRVESQKSNEDSVSLRQSSREKNTSENKNVETVRPKFQKPIVIERRSLIRPLDEFRGVILNSSLITSSRSQITIASLESNGPLANAKLDCNGVIHGMRARIKCSRAIWPDRTESIDALIRDGIDGVDSVRADDVYTGEEAHFIKSAFATVSGAFFDSAKNRSKTEFGDIESSDARNRLLEGLLGVADDTNQKALREGGRTQTIAVLDSGKQVTIQFLEEI